jgi:hypothetical protein
MTELETVLLFAFGVMLILWIQQRIHTKHYRAIIFAVGNKEARIEIDRENKTVRIVPN